MLLRWKEAEDSNLSIFLLLLILSTTLLFGLFSTPLAGSELWQLISSERESFKFKSIFQRNQNLKKELQLPQLSSMPQSRNLGEIGLSLQNITTINNLRIILYAVQVSEKKLEFNRLNHFQYCQKQGYEFQFFHLTPREFAQKYGYPYDGYMDKIVNVHATAAWYSILVAEDLIKANPSNSTHSVYLFKMDLDCLFSRTDLRIEMFLNLSSSYSFYITESNPSTMFTQSHAWIIKTDSFATALVKEWLEYRFFGSCSNAAVEQGGMHLAIGTLVSLYYGNNATKYPCSNQCNNLRRNGYKHHHCVLDWLWENRFTSLTNFHPNIKIFPYPENGTWRSLNDGFTFLALDRIDKQFIPLTIHPCKTNFYIAPEDVISKMMQICQRV